ncbi:MAG: ATP-binding protein [Polyangiales bacterium]
MKRIVLTGGPGAGKTAIQQVAVQAYPGRLVVVPEAATILFGGGFPRLEDVPSRKTSQRAIYHVQRELERLHEGIANGCALLCDRGTVDGAAYWPEPDTDAFFEEVGSSCAEELARYHAVIILDVPTAAQGYDHRNPTRIETPDEASRIGHRIQEAWRDHPRCTRVGAAPSFWSKIQRSVDLIGQALDG